MVELVKALSTSVRMSEESLHASESVPKSPEKKLDEGCSRSGGKGGGGWGGRGRSMPSSNSTQPSISSDWEEREYVGRVFQETGNTEPSYKYSIIWCSEGFFAPGRILDEWDKNLKMEVKREEKKEGGENQRKRVWTDQPLHIHVRCQVSQVGQHQVPGFLLSAWPGVIFNHVEGSAIFLSSLGSW